MYIVETKRIDRILKLYVVYLIIIYCVVVEEVGGESGSDLESEEQEQCIPKTTKPS